MKTEQTVRFPFGVLFTILVVMAGFYVLLENQEPTDQLYLGIGIVLVTMALAVSVSCFIVSKIYGFSRIFGISYLLLGIGFFFTFVGELSFVYYVDLMGEETSPVIADVSFVIWYGMTMTHLIINIRYFAQKIYSYQKILMFAIPVVMILAYSFLVFSTDAVDYEELPYSILAVSLSSLTVSFALIGFTLFKQTALMVAWFLLVLGMFAGAIGDVANYYLVALGDYGTISNYSTVLWIASNAIIMYALYRHQRAV